MNLWQWLENLQEGLVEAGQAPSAELIDRFTSEICDLNIEQTEALLPEVKALAKTLENPWLEVFIGHWEMRHRLGNKNEGESALPDVIRLFERAHRKDTESCPQSICVTQDLAACYANVDGPGWAAERIQVCDETLARITPEWNCFCCLSDERTEAMVHIGQASEALAFLEQQEAKLVAIGKEKSEIARSRIGILQALERHAEALDCISEEEEKEKREDSYLWPHHVVRRGFAKARSLAALGRDTEAWESLPPLPDVIVGDLAAWLKAAYALIARHPEENTWQLGRKLQTGLMHFSTHGAHRIVIDMAERCIQLALLRGSVWSAQRYLSIAEAHLDKLRADYGASAKLAELKQAIASASEHHNANQTLPAPADQLCAWLNQEGEKNDTRNPEQEIEWLLQALRERPEDTVLLEQTSAALDACGAHQAAADLLWAYLEQHTASEEKLSYELMGLLIKQKNFADLERLAKLYEKTQPITAHWCRAKSAEARSDWDAAATHCQALLATSPTSLGASYLLAGSLMQQQQFAAAAQVYFNIYQADSENKAPLWDYLTAASAAEDWAGVRQVAAILEFEIESKEGPIDEDWSWVLIRFFEDGEILDYYARRTGPATARIAQNSFGRFRQHVREHLVFDLNLINTPPQTDEERENFTPIFRAVHTLQNGGFAKSWLVDGVKPSEEEFDRLRDTLSERGFSIWSLSRADYQVTDSQSGETLPGLYFNIAAPESMAPSEIHQALKQATAHWAYPMCWLALARECKIDSDLHEKLVERYSL